MSMTKQASDQRSVRDQRLSIDRRHFKVVYAAAFTFYMAAFGFARLMPVGWCSRFCGIELKTGIIEQAKVQANILATYAITSPF